VCVSGASGRGVVCVQAGSGDMGCVIGAYILACAFSVAVAGGERMICVCWAGRCV
jgi:hypothetical protein